MNSFINTVFGFVVSSIAFGAPAHAATPIRAADFIAMQGVNLHVSQGSSNYKNMAMIKADMAYLGIVNVRDSLNPFWANPPYSYYTALAKAGLKWNYISAVGGTHSPETIATFLANVSNIEKAVPGSTYAVEGPNEINNFALTWAPTGAKGLPAALDFQTSLYAQTKASPLLKKLKVFYFTGYDAGTIPKGPDPTTTPGLADYNNQHPYPYEGKPPQRWVNRPRALGNTPAGVGPAVYTETGYQIPKTSSAQAASWTLNILANSAVNNIQRTYLYQLMDEADGWGLFSKADNTPTPAATAIGTMNAILRDTGPNARTFTPSKLISYKIIGLPATGNSFALQKSDTETNLVLWAEPDAFPGPDTLVTVRFSTSQPSVQVYDPLQGTQPIQALRNVTSVQVNITDHPIIIRLPSPTSLSSTTPKGEAKSLLSDGAVPNTTP